MVTLVEFLEARIAEDQAVAEAADPGTWAFADDFEMHGVGNIVSQTADGQQFNIAYDHDREAGYGAVDVDNATHIVRWDPARVLAECAAKRKVIDLHRMALGDGTEFKRGGFWEQVQVVGCVNCTVCSITGDVCIIEGPCETLLALAAPYASHEQFDPAWLPEVQVETGGGLGDH